MPDSLHPLERQRKIQAEAFYQVHLIVELLKAAGVDAKPWIAERDRLHYRLIRTQQQCEEHDV